MGVCVSMEIFPGIFSSLPALRVYLEGAGNDDDDERTLALVEALNVNHDVTVVYRQWLPQLAEILVQSEQTPLTPRQKVFLFACARDAYRVVLALIDHPEIMNQPVQNPVTLGMHVNMLHCAWYLIVSNLFATGYDIDIVHSDRVLSVLFREVGAARNWEEDDVPLAAENNIHALKWLVETQPITQGTFAFIVLTLLIENEDYIPWILNHRRAVNKTYTYDMVLRSAGSSHFVRILLRFWEQNNRDAIADQGGDDDESIMEQLFAFHAPATDIRVYLACADMFTRETVTYWMQRDVVDMERTYLIMDDQRMPLPDDLLHNVLSFANYMGKPDSRNAYVECATYVLTHYRITQAMINAIFDDEDDESTMMMLMETYSMLLRDPRYVYRDAHGVKLAVSGSSGALLALFQSARARVTNPFALLQTAVLQAKSPMTVRTILRFYDPTRVQMSQLLYAIDANPVGFYGVLQALRDHIHVDRAEANRFAIEAVGDDDVKEFWNQYVRALVRPFDRNAAVEAPKKLTKEPLNYM